VCRCRTGYDDDFIKLYDLTTLCSHLIDDVTTNPFTVPVGILLYRVARNMRMHGRQKSNIVRSLLEKCLLLLDAVKHAQVTHCLLLPILLLDLVSPDMAEWCSLSSSS